tara:strand:- start:51264 stop:51614 length:351 start_codon:yes stop_codon:yes gene_type:complete
MLGIGGVDYTIDLEALDVLITNKVVNGDKIKETEKKVILDKDGKVITTEEFTKEYDKVREIDMARYEVIRVLFEVILSTQDEIDDELGVDRALENLSLPFKLSFNTLLQYGIIKEI